MDNAIYQGQIANIQLDHGYLPIKIEKVLPFGC
jgi:hypothetical protein